MKEKEYTIETIKDILDAVNTENVDNFLVDFSYWLRLTIQAKSIEKYGVKVKSEPKMTWIDDGKHDNEIKIHIKSSPH